MDSPQSRARGSRARRSCKPPRHQISPGLIAVPLLLSAPAVQAGRSSSVSFAFRYAGTGSPWALRASVSRPETSRRHASIATVACLEPGPNHRSPLRDRGTRSQSRDSRQARRFRQPVTATNRTRDARGELPVRGSFPPLSNGFRCLLLAEPGIEACLDPVVKAGIPLRILHDRRLEMRR